MQGQPPADIAKRALTAARLGGYDVLILDTAGRTTLDEEMMSEAAEIARIAKPGEILLVADSLTGQDAVETARRFHERLPLTGLVLTRADGDGRGGAALSMRAVTGLPIKFLGVGERPKGLRRSTRAASPAASSARATSSRWSRRPPPISTRHGREDGQETGQGQFDFDDLASQLLQIAKMGGMKGVMGMLPGVQKIKNQIADAHLDDKQITRQIGIIRSMTQAERRKPDIINGSRRKRIAAGAGVEVAEVNKLIKMHRGMADMAKAMGKGKMPPDARRHDGRRLPQSGEYAWRSEDGANPARPALLGRGAKFPNLAGPARRQQEKLMRCTSPLRSELPASPPPAGGVRGGGPVDWLVSASLPKLQLLRVLTNRGSPHPFPAPRGGGTTFAKNFDQSN